MFVLLIVLFCLQSFEIRTFAKNCFVLNGLKVITPNDDSYERLNKQHRTTSLRKIKPEGFILVSDAFDVRKAIRCASENNITVTIKSGGHSFERYSFGSNRSWVIDLSKLNTIYPNWKEKTVTVGSGVRIGNLTAYLSNSPFIIPVGVCKSIGISGHSLGGGIGIVIAKHGLALDKIVKIQIVIASGKILVVSKSRRPDLFWALRGAGGGNFGVVTKINLSLTPAPKCFIRVTKSYENEKATLFHIWQQYVTSQNIDPSITSLIEIFAKKTVLEFHIATDTGTECEQLLIELRNIFPNITDNDVKRYSRYFDVQQEMFSDFELPEKDLPFFQVTTNFLVSKRLNVEESKAFTDIIANNQNGFWIFATTFGGVVNSIPRNETAFVHRTSAYNVWLRSSELPQNSSVDESKILSWKNFSFVENGESYQNYISKFEDNYLRRYYGENLERLVFIKNKYDPDNFFRFPQSIPLHI